MYSQVGEDSYVTESTSITTYRNLLTKDIPYDCDLRFGILEFCNWKIYEVLAIDDSRERMNVGRSVVNSYFHSTDFPEWNNHPTVLRIRSLAMDVIEALKEKEVKELAKRGNIHPDRKLLH